jgi:Baseplate J-like protein
MFEVEDEPTETLHIYVVREAAPKPSLLPIFLSVVALSLLVAVCALSPYQQPVTRAVIRVPAVLLPLKTFTAQVAIIPTGVRVYPATAAHGILTITNGSVISQTLPAGFIFITNSGVSVVTDQAVFVPAGNANGYGYAVVSAHAGIPGTSGNIPALAIDTVEGSSVYIRNLVAFRGGSDAYSVKVVTAQDRQTALASARQHLAVLSAGLHYPCSETITGSVTVTWLCQFVIYRLPTYMHVTGVTIQGKNLLVAVWFVARPVHIWVK